MLILGIETSCDETSVSVVEDGVRILSNAISSQVDVHSRYGGVVPELASRQHVQSILYVLDEAISDAGISLADIDGVAVTTNPGLIGALLIGLTAAKTISFALRVPLVGVNHIEAHVYANFLEIPPDTWPVVALVASGGHSDVIYLPSPCELRVIGRTRDDAAGEAFDKTARAMGLGYPGGPAIERIAREGNPRAIDFPRAHLEEGSYDFSFSGLKTAALVRMERAKKTGEEIDIRDFAASFQQAVVDILVEKTVKAAIDFEVRRVLVGGGVAANQALREAFRNSLPSGIELHFPHPELCTDNAAMVASAGYFRLVRGDIDGLELNADSR